MLVRSLSAIALLTAGAAFLAAQATPRLALLWLIGAGLGVALLHASFGFAGAFRRLLAEGRGAGFRAVLLLVAAHALLFLPALEAGSVLGQPVRGYVFETGWALLLGAFLFGIGMQVAGGCGSGTLYTAGGGSPRMLLALAGFVAGATLAAWQSPLWEEWPALPPVSLPASLGLWPALGLTLLPLAAAG
ncbi:MAG: YeeE/YedE family protein, partial [Acetobacteraceae bacterium]|nr:YeeE/YedE family protein [Acetobacteraceae bacterium]